MKLREGFITYFYGGEQYMVATGEVANRFRGIVRSNATAAYIIDCLKEEITQETLTDKLEAKYDAPRQLLEADVAKVLDALRKVDALDE